MIQRPNQPPMPDLPPEVIQVLQVNFMRSRTFFGQMVDGLAHTVGAARQGDLNAASELRTFSQLIRDMDALLRVMPDPQTLGVAGTRKHQG